MAQGTLLIQALAGIPSNVLNPVRDKLKEICKPSLNPPLTEPNRPNFKPAPPTPKTFGLGWGLDAKLTPSLEATRQALKVSEPPWLKPDVFKIFRDEFCGLQADGILASFNRGSYGRANLALVDRETLKAIICNRGGSTGVWRSLFHLPGRPLIYRKCANFTLPI
ncbi:hypothetical protein L0F63_001245 [Massospora cicadina]|nr:hypothetical protein L0F63_001245 [Massospora cicadina]